MTQRDRQKARRATTRAGSRTSGSATSRIEELEKERLELLARLAAAEATIKAFESQRIEAVNRIDWIIDSIHNVLERQS
jgi:hypothetical protein